MGFIVVGGVAVIAHGYLRYTKRVDLVVRLTREDIVAAFRALEGIDYHPSVPITAEQFADPAMRAQWQAEKGMLVLKFWSDLHRETPLDVFIYEPFDFAVEAALAYHSVEPWALDAAFVSSAALIAMKQHADRDHDRTDIAKLEKLAKLRSDECQS